MFLYALKKQYEAEQAEHTAVIDTFLQKPIGVADHDNFMKILRERFDKLTHVECSLKRIKDIEEKANGQKETENKTKNETKAETEK
tara:strand:- start:99 stop:356 length:258 start_codon:yes stop_codon:yes gene_type:complete